MYFIKLCMLFLLIFDSQRIVYFVLTSSWVCIVSFCCRICIVNIKPMREEFMLYQQMNKWIQFVSTQFLFGPIPSDTLSRPESTIPVHPPPPPRALKIVAAPVCMVLSLIFVQERGRIGRLRETSTQWRKPKWS